MNKGQLQKLVGKHAKLRPVATRIDATTNAQLEPIDDRWFVSNFNGRDGLSISIPRTDHGFTLPFDHIKEFVSDPNYPGEGFLILKVQVYVSGDRLWVEPLRA